jgi:hypothetical protein
MNIECKIKREGGTHVDIDNTKYHFAPLADGAHVAAVASEAHQDRFLGITDAYRVYRGSEKPKAAPKAAATTAPVTPAPTPAPTDAPQVMLLGSSVHPATFEIQGKTYALGDVVALAHAGSGLDAKEWNELEEASRADLIDEQLDKLNNAETQDTAPDERAQLAAEYETKFGKAAPGNWGVKKLREALAAA